MKLEQLFLFVVFTVLLAIGLGSLWGNTLEHETPLGYHASDAFQHQTRADAIKAQGTYVHEAPWIVAGYTDIIGFYPPGLYYLAIGLSNVSGLEVFDAIYVISFLFSVIGALLMYFVVRKFNKTVAILSLPFSALIFTGISMVGFTWGATTSLVAQVFIILVIWIVLYIDERWSWLALGIALSGAVLTHSSELVIAGGFMAVYFVWTAISHFVLKQKRVSQLRTMLIGGLVFIALSWYFIAIAQLVWAKLYPLNPFEVWTTHGGYPGIVNLTDYGIMLLFMAGGLIAGLGFLWKSKAAPPVALLAGVYMLIIGFGNFFGLNYRAFQIRYFWPIYLGIFLGLGIYVLAQLTIKRIPQLHAIGASLILLVAFSGVVALPLVPHVVPTPTAAVDAAHWDTFTWLRENTPKDAVLYFFYGDLYRSNAVLRNTERTHYQVLSHMNPDNTADFITKLQQGAVSDTYDSALLGDCCGAAYPYWKGFGQVGFRFHEIGRDKFYKPTNICQMDYYIFDKAASVPALAQYNIMIANAMMASGNFELAHQNEISIILKNNRPGETCIGNATG